MTPCEKLDYKAGDRFIVKGSNVFRGGSIIELEYDDRSYSPLFKLISGSCKCIDTRAYCNLIFVQKIEEKEMTHQKKPHRHAEMIKAKEDNMELVTLIKKHSDWQAGNEQDEVIFDSIFECFLCLPKHKEACLHWLNGGLIECNSKSTNGWEDCADYNEYFWRLSCGMMREDANYRIKPRKEKRWIAVKRNDKTEVYTVTFDYLDEAIDTLNEKYWQFIEIEVEV